MWLWWKRSLNEAKKNSLFLAEHWDFYAVNTHLLIHQAFK